MTETIEFSRPFALERLGSGRAVLELEASPGECEALTRRFDLPAVKSLRAEVTLEAKPGLGLLVVKGRLHALVEQVCVVTLLPFEEKLVEDFEQHYRLDGAESDDDGGAIVPDAPEPLPEGGLDLGEEVTQQLSLALNPYPRSPGAQLPEDASDAKASPFAALSGLRGAGKGEKGKS